MEYKHIPGQACFAISRLISWANVGLEPGTFQFRVDVTMNNDTTNATVDRLHVTKVLNAHEGQSVAYCAT